MSLKYTVIKSEEQFKEYCRKVEALDDLKSKSQVIEDEIELLVVLIEAWDNEHNSFPELDCPNHSLV